MNESVLVSVAVLMSLIGFIIGVYVGRSVAYGRNIV